MRSKQMNISNNTPTTVSDEDLVKTLVARAEELEEQVKQIRAIAFLFGGENPAVVEHNLSLTANSVRKRKVEVTPLNIKYLLEKVTNLSNTLGHRIIRVLLLSSEMITIAEIKEKLDVISSSPVEIKSISNALYSKSYRRLVNRTRAPGSVHSVWGVNLEQLEEYVRPKL